MSVTDQNGWTRVRKAGGVAMLHLFAAVLVVSMIGDDLGSSLLISPTEDLRMHWTGHWAISAVLGFACGALLTKRFPSRSAWFLWVPGLLVLSLVWNGSKEVPGLFDFEAVVEQGGRAWLPNATATVIFLQLTGYSLGAFSYTKFFSNPKTSAEVNESDS